MRNMKRGLALALSAALLTTGLTGCGAKQTKLLDPDNPTTVTVWNYYNGDQLTGFEKLVSEFNETIGAEQGIVVTSVSQGSIDNLASCLLDAVDGKVGADNVPSLASVYSDAAFILQQKDAIVPLDSYYSEEELAEYYPGFIDEGRLTEGGSIYEIPVSKSTEAFIVNATDWAPFAQATGITPDSVDSYEALTAAAKAYYEWTDSQTPDQPEDGKALYGRDAVANYIYIGTKQLGHQMFSVGADGTVTVDLDRDTFKTLWDNYYIPYINGWFGSFASYRSEDIKTGAVLSMIGSTSGVSYISTTVTDANDVTHDIEVEIRPVMQFENAVTNVNVQQGAGYALLKTSEAEQYAAVEFLKWFTDTDQNLAFSIGTGYSPVKIEANDAEKITQAFTVDSPKAQNMLSALLVSAEVYNTTETYTCRAFAGSKEIRDALSGAMEKAATEDRAKVAEQLAAGVPHEEAVAPFSTDEYFDAWFDALCADVNALVG